MGEQPSDEQVIRHFSGKEPDLRVDQLVGKLMHPPDDAYDRGHADGAAAERARIVAMLQDLAIHREQSVQSFVVFAIGLINERIESETSNG